MKTFSRPASISMLGKFLGPDGVIEEPSQTVKVNGREVIFYDIRPRLPENPRRIILGYAESGYRRNGDKMDIDYNENISREDRMALMKMFPDINLQFGERPQA